MDCGRLIEGGDYSTYAVMVTLYPCLHEFPAVSLFKWDPCSDKQFLDQETTDFRAVGSDLSLKEQQESHVCHRVTHFIFGLSVSRQTRTFWREHRCQGTGHHCQLDP